MLEGTESQGTTPGNKSSESKLLLTGKIGRLYQDMVPVLRNFPKTQKYTLAQNIEQELLSCAKLVLGATYQRDGRMQRLHDLRVNFYLLAFLLRQAQGTGCLSIGLYEKFSRDVSEMGKMSSAWIKTELAKKSNSGKFNPQSTKTQAEILNL